MECKKCMEQMSLHLDNMADRDEKEFQQHIRSCKECRLIYENMASTREHLDSLPEEEVPEGFHDAWMKAAAAQKAKSQKPNLKWVRIAGPIAAALVVAVIGWQAFFANGILLGGNPDAAPAPMALTMDKPETAQKSIVAATAAPTMAPAMDSGAGEAGPPMATAAPAASANSAEDFSAARQETISYTITGKPEAQQDLQDLLNAWKVTYQLNDLDGATGITFTIGPENYTILMDWLAGKGAQPPPSDAHNSDKAGTMCFEIIFK